MFSLRLISVSEKVWLSPRFRTLQLGSGPLPGLCALGILLYSLWHWQSLQAQEPVAAIAAATDERPVAPDYRRIEDWHLFGGHNAETPGAPEQPVASELQLKLLGTFVLSALNDRRYAIVQHSDGAQRRYRVGDRLSEDVVLESVDAKRIVVRNRQRLESLAFPASAPAAAP
jgi:hypothetical protein